MKRYDRTKLLDFGKFYGTSSVSANLRAATVTRSIMTKPQVLLEGERLDQIAFPKLSLKNSLPPKAK